MKQKANLHLVSRKNALDANALAKLFEKLTGKKASSAQIAAAKAKLGG